MDKNIKKRRELIQAIIGKLENQDMTSELDFDSIAHELENDPELLNFYVDFMIQHSGLTQAGINSHAQVLNPDNLDHCVINSTILTQLSFEERNAPTMESKNEIPKPIVKPLYFKRYYPLVGMFAILISCIVSTVFWIDMHDNKAVAAQVVDTCQTKWKSGSYKLTNNDLIYDNNKKYKLKQGTIKILFEDGAQVVINGPAEFSVTNNDRMQIESGKIFVHVPSKSIGFRVDTPSCDIVDLGTEFGINVNSREAEVHLIEGKAMLVPSVKLKDSFSEIITENQARHITSGGQISERPFNGTEFVRDFDSKSKILWNGKDLSLTDIVTGGNGFGLPEENSGIDPKTCQIVHGNSECRNNYDINGYQSVSFSKYIDGVFVPDGGNGDVQLNSSGQTYDQFCDTGGDYFMPIGVYSYITLCYSNATGSNTKSIHLEGYPEGKSVNLCMHANSGITFDLDNIRKDIGFANIKGFTSVIGIPVTYEDQEDVCVDFYVFIDGKAVIVRKEVSNRDKPEKISIPITDEMRFLTLATTEGEQNYGDWSVFVDPVLKLEKSDEE